MYACRNVAVASGGCAPAIVLGRITSGLAYLPTAIGDLDRWDNSAQTWVPLRDAIRESIPFGIECELGSFFNDVGGRSAPQGKCPDERECTHGEICRDIPRTGPMLLHSLVRQLAQQPFEPPARDPETVL